MHIGVTGTRSGMTDYQRKEVVKIFEDLKLIQGHRPPTPTVHHGDCRGVDVEFAEIAKANGCLTVCHPPTKTDLRAYHESTTILEPKSYFARNRDIVNACSMLFVIPYQMQWQSSGGTWYTHDYAKKRGVMFKVIWPKQRGGSQAV